MAGFGLFRFTWALVVFHWCADECWCGEGFFSAQAYVGEFHESNGWLYPRIVSPKLEFDDCFRTCKENRFVFVLTIDFTTNFNFYKENCERWWWLCHGCYTWIRTWMSQWLILPQACREGVRMMITTAQHSKADVCFLIDISLEGADYWVTKKPSDTLIEILVVK